MGTLAHKWLDKEECERFLSELHAAGELKRIIRVPLLANLTLAIFKEIGALPESTTRLYEMFVQLLCGGWDSAKNIRRDTEFGAGPKRTVITRVAWIAHNSRLRDFAEADFKSAVGQTLSGLAGQASSLLRECIHDGILIQGGDRYAFAHLSFQEYLVANHLNDPRGYRQRQALREYLEGDSWWTEVMRFFVAAAEDPNETAKWIVDVTEHISGRGQSHPTEIKSRADELISALQAYHKGFRPEKRTKKSLQRLSLHVR
jgi:predicted NACHT family NTPase